MALLSDRDARAWQTLASKVSDEVAPKLASGVLANRTLAQARCRMHLGLALRRAASAANLLAATSEGVIRTDVREFYLSVTPSVACRSLVALDVDPDLAVDSAHMLDAWGSEGYGGLPIGPPGSAVIANTVLAAVDRQLRPLPFLRWVDDYLIGLQHPRQAPEVMERIDAALGRAGLDRHQGKTRLLEGGKPISWLGTYGCRGSSLTFGLDVR